MIYIGESRTSQIRFILRSAPRRTSLIPEIVICLICYKVWFHDPRSVRMEACTLISNDSNGNIPEHIMHKFVTR